jgi:phage terminase small subunit
MGLKKGKRKYRGITHSQRLFALEYVRDGNATRAFLAVRPKVKVTTAGSEGHKLLKNPDVKKLIHSLQTQLVADAAISNEMLIKEAGKIAMVQFDPSFVKVTEKLNALELLMKQRGMLKEIKVNQTFEDFLKEQTP